MVLVHRSPPIATRVQPAAPQARVSVFTFGRVGVDTPTPAAAERLLSQPKRLAVLLYVLMSQRGGSLTRDQLISAFWPESDDVRASNALRQTLSFLRGCVGGDLITSVGTRGIAVSDAVECDAVSFDRLLDAGQKEDALLLYSGEFLPGFHLDGAPAFTEWLDARRRSYAQRAAKASWDLSADCEAREEFDGAAFWGKRALALSPFSESEVQRVLRLLTRVGDYAGALRAYHGLQRVLKAEFGAAPSAETSRLAAEAIGQLQASGGHAPALLGSRRAGIDRRFGERRTALVQWTGVERRVQPDRRQTERRSGEDRRAVR